MAKVKMTVEQLESLVSRVKNQVEYGDMNSYVLVSVGEHPNGCKFIEFEQPCVYAECNSSYHRYDG